MQQTDIMVQGNLGIRQFSSERKCENSGIHKHNYDHMTMCISGWVLVTTGDKTKELSPGAYCHVEAGIEHSVKALEDKSMWYCIFSHRDFDGMVSQSYVGNQSAYF